MGDREPRFGEVEEHGVGGARGHRGEPKVPLLTLAAHVAVPHRAQVGQPIDAELVSCGLDAGAVELKGVEVAGGAMLRMIVVDMAPDPVPDSRTTYPGRKPSFSTIIAASSSWTICVR